ncbi:MAG: aminotransferase class V-fold PLP-dependent enzyme [Actinomycetota bacterium]
MPDARLTLPAIRDALPALADSTYLNTGGAGPLPVTAARAVERAVADALTAGRGSLAAYEAMTARHDRLRAALAGILNAVPDEIALAGSSTHALNMALWGIDWRDGDEVITTNLEHPGLLAPLQVIARRRGVTIRTLDVGTGDEDLEGAVARAATPRTRAVALSHVTWSTGAVLDVAGAARAARDIGAFVIVDGAQGIGAIPTDPRALGADAYAIPAHKWLLGPDGLGALWVRADAVPRIDLTYAGIASGTDHAADGAFLPHPAARRLETSTHPEMLVPGWIASLHWLRDLGWDWIHQRIRAGAADARRRLAAIPGVDILTPPGHGSGLLSFTIAGADPVVADARLVENGIVGRWIPHPYCLRVSIGFYADAADLDRMADGVALIASRR